MHIRLPMGTPRLFDIDLSDPVLLRQRLDAWPSLSRFEEGVQLLRVERGDLDAVPEAVRRRWTGSAQRPTRSGGAETSEPEPEFVTEARSAVFSGHRSQGISHLAVAIAYRAIQNGFDARSTTAVSDLSRAAAGDRLRDGALAPLHHQQAPGRTGPGPTRWGRPPGRSSIGSWSGVPTSRSAARPTEPARSSERRILAKTRAGAEAAVRLLNLLNGTSALDREWIGAERFARAEALFRQYRDQAFSFTDCTSFAVMRERRLQRVVTGDDRFRIMGFELLP